MTRKLIPVQGDPFLFRDANSKAVINTNETEFLKAKEKKVKHLEEKRKSEQVINDINNLKEEMKDLKEILSQILNKLN